MGVLKMFSGCFKDVLIVFTLFLISFMCFIFVVVHCLDLSGEVGKSYEIIIIIIMVTQTYARKWVVELFLQS